MQGREKDLVIFSFARSNHIRRVGFLKEKQRLNVGMSHGRKFLILFGDIHTLADSSSQWKDRGFYSA